MKVLLLYTTHEHQTEKIMQRIKLQLEKYAQCDLILLQKESQVNLSNYQAVLIGSSIRYGYYSHVIKNFINRHHHALNQMVTGFFGVNLVARKAHKNTPETNLYTKKFLANIQWQPKIAAVFAGALYYPQYNWFDRNMIRMIMWLGKGETDISKAVVEYTDWNKVDLFAEQFSQQLPINAHEAIY